MISGELYTSLQQGIVDGAENNPPNFYQSKHFEVSKYYILDEHAAPPDVLLIGTHTWNKLSDEQRAWVTQAVAESVAYQRKLWDEATTEALQKVADAGIEVIYPDKAPFRSAVAPLYESLEGSEIGGWADKIMNLPPVPEAGAEGDSTLNLPEVN
ncbi:MAG: TRAP transporter substrate-binding protein DctP [Bacteroidota bacterium]